MANNTINVRIIINNKTSTAWGNDSTYVPLKGELCIESDTRKMKVGDGVSTYSNLDYMYYTPSQIDTIVGQLNTAIDGARYTLPKATSSTLGGVMIGNNITLSASTGSISIANASTSVKGVVQLNSSVTSTSNSVAATAGAVKTAYDTAVTAQQAADQKLSSITISTGDNNGQIKYSVNNGNATNVDVKGLGTAAYTNSTAYATAAQGTLATNAMPKSGGTFSGNVTIGSGKTLTLSGDPTSNLHAATKSYVDSAVSSGLQVADAMRYKGTLGTDGTVTSLPTTNVKKGDTYKVIVAGTYASKAAKVGDLFIASNDSDDGAVTWDLVPSGDEAITTIKVATSGVNVNDTAKTGNIVLGMAAQKQIDESINEASTSANLPTSAAVAAFVEGKGYKTTDNDTKVTQTHVEYNASGANTNRPLLLSYYNSSQTTNGAQVSYRNKEMYANPSTGTIFAKFFNGTSTDTNAVHFIGNATSANTLKTARNIGITGNATGTAASFNGSASVNISLSTISTDAFVNGSDTLILNGSVA